MDEDGNIREVAAKGDTYPGWMTKMAATCDMQLNLVYSQNIGAIRSVRSLGGWLELIEAALGEQLQDSQRKRWTASLAPFYDEHRACMKYANEGGFLIRFNDWVQRRLQRRWYLETFGRVTESQDKLRSPSPLDPGASAFARPTLPSFLGPPPVPSVLPFHTVNILLTILISSTG